MLFRASIDPTKFKADRTSWELGAFLVLLNVIAIRTLETVRYDLT